MTGKSRSFRFVLRFILLLSILIASSLIYVGCAADSIILPANHESINPGGARREQLKVYGRTVEYWIARSPSARDRQPDAFVLFFVGKGDRADRWINAVANAWDDKPVELWGMNYPGSGGSQGPPSMDRVGADALAVYDAMSRAVEGRPIFIQAGSFGTTAALSVAARRNVAGLILQNPLPLRQLIMGQYGWWNLWLLAGPVALRLPSDLDSLANARHAKAPAIFLLAGADEVIPPRYHRMVVDAYAGRKYLINISGAHHNDPLTREAAEELHKDLDKLWREPATGRAR